MFKNIKIIGLSMAVLLAVTLFISCNKAEKTPQADNTAQLPVQQSTDQPKGSSSQGPEEIKLPIVQQPLTLSYFTPMDAKIGATLKSFGEMTCYKEMEKRTGIHLDFQHPPEGQTNEQFNLMIASQEMADIIDWEWLTATGGPEKYIQENAILPLNDLIRQYAPNLTKLMDQYPQIRKEISTDSGHFYAFPSLNIDPRIRVYWGFQIRQDWLDKLNLQNPKNIDEWYTVLKTFKEKDPNGNGKADEIPFVAQGIGDLSQFMAAWGISPLSVAADGFYVQDGKIKYAPVENVYKDFLTTMNKWYTEGLIDLDYASTDAKQLDAKVTSGLAGSWVGLLSGRLGRFNQLAVKNIPSFKAVGVPYPTAPDGKSYIFHNRSNKMFTGRGAAISTKNKYPKETTKYLDYAYSEEGSLIMNFGVEGVSYNMVNGYPKLVDSIIKNPNGLSIDEALGQHTRSAGSGPFIMDARVWEQRMSMPVQQEAVEIWKKASSERALPPITPTPEESSKFASIISEINTYRDEMFNKFIMGQQSLQNFDEYIQTLKKMGIDEAINIQQAALDRYNAR